eukprot:gene18858-biopygen5453
MRRRTRRARDSGRKLPCVTISAAPQAPQAFQSGGNSATCLLTPAADARFRFCGACGAAFVIVGAHELQYLNFRPTPLEPMSSRWLKRHLT